MDDVAKRTIEAIDSLADRHPAIGALRVARDAHRLAASGALDTVASQLIFELAMIVSELGSQAETKTQRRMRLALKADHG